VPERLQEQMRLELTAIPAVDQVTELYTSVIGMSEVLVAARATFVAGADVSSAADEAERRLKGLYPVIRFVFLSPTKLVE
jgi:hypothetical protein